MKSTIKKTKLSKLQDVQITEFLTSRTNLKLAKDDEAFQKDLVHQIFTALNSDEIVVIRSGKVIKLVKKQQTNTLIDSKRLKEEKPEIFKEYSITKTFNKINIS
jgi:predicted phage-related endonuclease